MIVGETDKASKSRMAAMTKRSNDAVVLLSGQQSSQALRALDEVQSDVPSEDYSEVNPKASTRPRAGTQSKQERFRSCASCRQARQL